MKIQADFFFFALGQAENIEKAIGNAFLTLAHPDNDKDDRLVAIERDAKTSKAHFNLVSVGGNKFVTAGAAEQNMVCVSQGIGVRGKVPFCVAPGAHFSR